MLLPRSTELPPNRNSSMSKYNTYCLTNLTCIQLTRLQEYSNASLKEYFDQDALLFPTETIIAKTERKDFNFFLEQNNFLKVVDTLEKFQNGLVNTQSDFGKEFVLFKRQLY